MVSVGAKMSKTIHNSLLKKVLNAPVNLYFDITPVGKLLKYFTSDIGRIDRAFFWHIQWVGDTLADVLIKIGFACYFCPNISIFVVINFYILYRIT